MGREVRRVALDFSWPLEKVWEGFVNPHHESVDCMYCQGRGESPEARHLHDLWYGKVPFDPASTGSKPFTEDTPEVRAFAERNCKSAPHFYGFEEESIRREASRLCRLWNGMWMHHLSQDDVDVLVAEGRLSMERGLADLTADTVNRAMLNGMGHDCINQWLVAKARLAKDNTPSTCSHCNGEGSIWISEEGRIRHESWTPQDPPAGEGYQIWETVSEGSPISPVFALPQDLAAWMERHNDRVDRDTTAAQWLKFILGPGWSPTFAVMGGAGLQSGVQAMTSRREAIPQLV